jgi:four helix bundle protein
MNPNELRERTKQFALSIIKVVEALPNTVTGRAISNQLVRCGTSVGANYRAACRGRSKAEFNSKLHIFLEEADESVFWLEIIKEKNLLSDDKIISLLNEAEELTKIFSKSYYTAKQNK